MNKVIYSFALFIAVITFTFSMISGISIFTGFVRSAIVFLGMLLIFSVAGQILKLIIVFGNQKDKNKDEQEEEAPQEGVANES